MTTPLAATQPPNTTHTLLEPSPGSGLVQRTVLPGGLRIVTETVPNTRSAAFAIGTTTSSRDEHPGDAGSSHFLEHLLYKGTTSRSPIDITRDLERAGARHNAGTTLDWVLYHAQVDSARLPEVVDVITDMILNSTLDPEEVDREREVIVAEIAQMYDWPPRLLQDMMANLLYGDHAMGQSNLGTPEGIRVLPLERIRAQYKQAYAPHNLIILATGDIDHAQVVDMAADKFADRLHTEDRPRAPRPSTPALTAKSGTRIHHRNTEQAHLLMGVEGVSHTHPDLPALTILENILAGGQSSRIFEQLRENRGLVYRVRRSHWTWDDTGMAGMLTACALDNLDEVITRIRDIFRDMAKGVTSEELERGRALAVADHILGRETMLGRLSDRYQQELHLPRHVSLAEEITELETVTPQDVAQVAEQVYSGPLSLAVVGPVENREWSL